MEIKLTSINSDEILFTGESINSDSERQDNKKYKVEIKLSDGTIVNRYTDYYQIDEESKDIAIEGMTFKEVQLLEIRGRNND